MKRLNYLWLAICVLGTCTISAQSLHVLSKDLPCLNKNYNVYVHVALDSLRLTNYSPEDITKALELTNKFFSPICMSFTLCKYDTIYNYNFDSLAQRIESAEVTTLFEERNRLNIYIVEELDDPSICGFGGKNIFLKKNCGPGTLVHEMGHVFGLMHTFEENGLELVDGSNCDTAGDKICDTPADPYDPELAKSILYQRGCEFTFMGLDANGQFYQPDMGNIMSYYGCDCGFTRGQYLRMVETYNNGKRELW
jgi:Pregnancy-associated plasma protein-A